MQNGRQNTADDARSNSPPVPRPVGVVEALERQLAAERAARQAVERRDAAKDALLSAVAHELGTPLAAISGWAQLLRRAGTAAEVAEVADVIDRNVKAQARLVQDLLDVARMLAGRDRLTPRRVELNDPVEAAIDEAVPAAVAKGVRLRADVEPMAGTVSGDPIRLQQVVGYLLSNAVRHTPAGGCVTVELTGGPTHVDLIVTDTGNGFREDELPHLFDRFARPTAGGGAAGGGLGVGLTLAKHWVDLHGGTIAAASDGPGTGATFTFRLPLAVVFNRGGDEAVAAGGGAAAEDGPPPDLAGLSVLVVDDQQDALIFVRRVLADSGADVTAADSMDAALAALDDRPFDLLVSDISMPEHDGYELIHRVRSRPPAKNGLIRAVALTALTQELDLRRSLGAGYNMHLNKPVDADELLRCVGRLVETKLAT
ncbi:MAG: histidine kinase [Phycisphaerales bacterium]|nr:histidine kinase [Phycisphaerales bacterium]